MASPFASECQSESIALPFDPGQSVVVRKLTGGEVEAAELEALKSFASGRLSRGFSGHVARILSGAAATPEDIAKAANDPLKGYDRLTLIRSGLVSWTYDKPIKPTVVDKAIVDHVADLDDVAQEFIATEVMRRTKPWLFQTAEEREAAKVKG